MECRWRAFVGVGWSVHVMMMIILEGKDGVGFMVSRPSPVSVLSAGSGRRKGMVSLITCLFHDIPGCYYLRPFSMICDLLMPNILFSQAWGYNLSDALRHGCLGSP